MARCLKIIDVCVVKAPAMTLNSEEEVGKASWRGNQKGMSLMRKGVCPGRGRREHGMAENQTEPGRAGESMGCQESIGEMRWSAGRAEAGPWRAWALGFSFERRGTTKGVYKASGKMSDLCVRNGSKEPVRKLCQ